MEQNFGDIICQYRQLRKMTQEEFASKLGVTPQAVSKWERGNGMPDVSLLKGICTVLDISANKLLGINETVVENKNISADMEIRNNMIAEPLVLEFRIDVVPCIAEGLKTNYVNEKRLELVKSTGILMPMVQLRDNVALLGSTCRILSYDKVLAEWQQPLTTDSAYTQIMDKLTLCCRKNYSFILNKQLVKTIIDNLNERFFGIAKDIVPSKISYLQIERFLQKKLAKGESIRDLIHILEEMEEAL